MYVFLIYVHHMCNFGTLCQMPNIFCSVHVGTHMLLMIDLQYKTDIVAFNFCFTDVHPYILHPLLAFKIPFGF